jgi:pimeloyl-ACP methyl ester carboxylesterase
MHQATESVRTHQHSSAPDPHPLRADEIPIIFLSGMATDERLFESQLAAFPNMRVQSWVAPVRGESLRAYAARIATQVDPGRPCIVGGASFGGVVALELATHVQALGCILIGSIRSPAGLPRRWRLLRPVAWLGPDALRVLAGFVAGLGRPLLSASAVRSLRRLAQPKAAFERWAMCALLRWRPSSDTGSVRVFHIHGAADRVLPVELGCPDVVVPGGSHALPLFSPSAVNEFIARAVEQLFV